MIYIHYGSDCFRPSEFLHVTNEGFWNKPCGGFWASPVGAKCGWSDWCESEGFTLDSFNSSFSFTLVPAARVIHLYTSKDLDRMPCREDSSGLNRFLPDFEKMVKDGWDAIELHLSSNEENWYKNGLYWRLYGWDCDSILIMNPDIIVPLSA